jgi:hypothetical protein
VVGVFSHGSSEVASKRVRVAELDVTLVGGDILSSRDNFRNLGGVIWIGAIVASFQQSFD